MRNVSLPRQDCFPRWCFQMVLQIVRGQRVSVFIHSERNGDEDTERNGARLHLSKKGEHDL